MEVGKAKEVGLVAIPSNAHNLWTYTDHDPHTQTERRESWTEEDTEIVEGLRVAVAAARRKGYSVSELICTLRALFAD
jgi:hypothetical protein